MIDSRKQCDYDMNYDPQYFLLQVNHYGSNQIFEQGMYEHVGWESNRKHIAHSEIKSGDLVLVYFTSTAPFFKQTLKMIYRVKSVTKNKARFYLDNWKELHGLSHSTIQKLIKKNQLSKSFERCAGGSGGSGRGYNIIKISKTEFETVLKTDIATSNSDNSKQNPLSEDEKLCREIELSQSKEVKSKKELEEELEKLNGQITKAEPRIITPAMNKIRYDRLKSIVDMLKKIHKKCMICKEEHFETQNGALYSEVSHIIPFNVSHNDHVENLMVLCPTCHKKFDNAKYVDRKKLYETLRRNFPSKKFERPSFL